MKTVLIILSAGRCGSTNIINRLNQEKDINIYGESFGGILSLIKSAYEFNQYKEKFIDTLSIRKQNSQTSFFPPNQISLQLEGEKKYIGNEFYNDHEVLKDTLNTINNSIINFFKGENNIVGFKDIRWHYYPNLIWLNHLKKLPFKEVKFLKLNRNIEEQTQSMLQSLSPHVKGNPSNYQECLERIKKCNYNIDSYLNKVKEDKKYECNYVENSEFHLDNILKWLKD